MVDIHEAERQLRRMKLRAGIIRYLTKNYRHVNSIRGSFRWATDEEFYAAVESLLNEELLSNPLAVSAVKHLRS